MVTRTTIARLQQRIEAAVSRLDSEPPKPQRPSDERIREMRDRFQAEVARYEARLRATETPEQTKARELKEAQRKAEIERRVQEALADPDVDEHRELLMEMGLDEEEATRRARLDAKLAAWCFPEESRETRRRQRIEHYRKYWEGPPEMRDKVLKRYGGDDRAL